LGLKLWLLLLLLFGAVVAAVGRGASLKCRQMATACAAHVKLQSAANGNR